MYCCKGDGRLYHCKGGWRSAPLQRAYAWPTVPLQRAWPTVQLERGGRLYHCAKDGALRRRPTVPLQRLWKTVYTYRCKGDARLYRCKGDGHCTAPKGMADCIAEHGSGPCIAKGDGRMNRCAKNGALPCGGVQQTRSRLAVRRGGGNCWPRVPPTMVRPSRTPLPAGRPEHVPPVSSRLLGLADGLGQNNADNCCCCYCHCSRHCCSCSCF